MLAPVEQVDELVAIFPDSCECCTAALPEGVAERSRSITLTRSLPPTTTSVAV
jgi:hypothetical protein